MPFYQFETYSAEGKAIYKSAKFEATNLEDAASWRDYFLDEHPEFRGNTKWILYQGRGGRRRNAGRPAGSTKEQTKVVRVPKSINIEKIISFREDLITLLEAHKKEIHPTSPRDERARLLIEEIESIL